MPRTLAPLVAQGVSRPLSYVCNPVGVACSARHVHHRTMEKSTDTTQIAATDLEPELESWDWARAAGVSVEELRQALLEAFAAPEVRQAA